MIFLEENQTMKFSFFDRRPLRYATTVTKALKHVPCHATHQQLIKDHQPDLPRKNGGDEPRQQADERRPGLGAYVARLQGLADGVVSLEADGQDRQHGSVGHGELHEGHCLT